MPKSNDLLTVTRDHTARIFALWWARYIANPEGFQTGPDGEGISSADNIFQLSEEIAQMPPA